MVRFNFEHLVLGNYIGKAEVDCSMCNVSLSDPVELAGKFVTQSVFFHSIGLQIMKV
jgi:hypothetical protein